jgi:hypothetical protein
LRAEEVFAGLDEVEVAGEDLWGLVIFRDYLFLDCVNDILSAMI